MARHAAGLRGFTFGLIWVAASLLAACGPAAEDTAGGISLANVTDVSVTPTSATISIGGTQQYTSTISYADGTTADGTTVTSWSSGNLSIATIDAAGLATGVGEGTVFISGDLETSDTFFFNLVSLSVVEATGVEFEGLNQVTLSPSSATLDIGATQQFTATGHYDDGSTADVSTAMEWSVFNTAVATVNDTGLVTAVGEGTATVDATLNTSSGFFFPSASITVTNLRLSELTELAVTPTAATIDLTAGRQFFATATYNGDSGDTADVTNAATWSSGDSAVATVDAFGTASAVGEGTTNITATLGDVSAFGSLTVADLDLEQVTDLEISPTSLTVARFETRQLTATAIYGDGSTADFSTVVPWTSNNEAIVTVDSTGLVTGVGLGSTSVTVSYNAGSNFFFESVSVSVVETLYSVGGEVSGLTGTLVLQNNLTDDLTIEDNGSYTFPQGLEDGSTYSVTVSQQPSGQECTVSNATGTISGGGAFNVSVSCEALGSFSIASVDPAAGYTNDLGVIVVTFSRDADFTTRTNTANYVLSGDAVGSLTLSSLSSFTDASVVTLTLSGTPGEGEITLTVSGITAADGAALEGTTTFDYIYDVTEPEITAVTPSEQDVQGIIETVTLTFSEEMLKAGDAGNYTVSGEAGEDLVSVESVTENEDGTYTLNLDGIPQDGTLTITVAAEVTDRAGNSLDAANLDDQIVYTVDVDEPTVVADPESGSYVATLTYVSLTFSETVTGADETSNYDLSGDGAGDLSVSSVTAIDGYYQLVLLGTPGEGELVITISNVVSDEGVPLAGNTVTYNLDPTPPGVVYSPPDSTELGSTLEVVVTYDEQMLGATNASNYDIDGEGAGNLRVVDAMGTGANEVTLSVFGYPGAGTLDLTLETTITDLAGNNVPESDYQVSYEGFAPYDLRAFFPGIQSLAFGGGTYVAVGNAGAIHTSTDGQNWTVQDLGSGSVPLYRVIYDGSQFIAFTNVGYAFATSSDGDTWEWRPSNLDGDETVNGLAYDGTNTYVLVTTDSIFYSTDLETWSQAYHDTFGVNPSITGVAYGNGVFIAVNSSTAFISEDGQEWEFAGHGLANASGIAYGEPGATPTFVIVSTAGSSQSRVSTNDGTTWSGSASISLQSGKVFHDGTQYVTYGQGGFAISASGTSWDFTSGSYVAMTGNGTDRWVGASSLELFTTADIGNNTFISTLASLGNLATAAQGNGVILAAGSDGQVQRSEDGGGTWEAVGELDSGGSDMAVRGIGYGNMGNIQPESTPSNPAIADNSTTDFTIDVQVGPQSITDVRVLVNITHTNTGDLDITLISPDATEVLLVADRGGTGDNFDGTLFSDAAATAIADGTPPFDAGPYTPEEALSAFDGESAIGTWTLRVVDDATNDTGTLDSWTLLINGETHAWVAVGAEADGDGDIQYSLDDGDTWTNISSDVTGTPFNAVKWDDTLELWVAAGDGRMAYSSNLTTWNFVLFTGLNMRDVTSDGIRFLAVGDDGSTSRVRYSLNGASWAAANAPGGTSLRAVTHDGTNFIALGVDGAVALSPNGTSWGPGTSPGNFAFTSVANDGSSVLAVGDEGVMYISDDSGATWSIQNSGSKLNLKEVIYDSDFSIFVIVGDGGTVIASQSD